MDSKYVAWHHIDYDDTKNNFSPKTNKNIYRKFPFHSHFRHVSGEFEDKIYNYMEILGHWFISLPYKHVNSTVRIYTN